MHYKLLAQPFLKVVYMNFSSLADPFIPLLNNTKRENGNYDLIMLSLYKDILEADKYVKNCSIHSRTTVDADGPINLPNNNRFFPKAIRKYIQDNPSSLFNFNCILKGREININYYSFNGSKADNYKKYTNIMLVWLYICAKHSSKKCAETMNVNIYLTPFKKTLPSSNTTVLSADHINTAFTMCCVPEGEITIYRAEEWFKVFIHETFHAYGLDFGLHEPKQLNKTLSKLFPIKSDFNACEAYTETWARIINCVLYSFYSMGEADKAKETFLLYVNFCLELERLFAIHQMSKILQFMGLNYKDLYKRGENSTYLRQQLYKEDTHVFAYYVLTAIFLNDYKDFIQWCGDINGAGVGANGVGANGVGVNGVGANGVGANGVGSNAMKFKCTEQSFSKMSDYISSMYGSKELLKTIQEVKTRNKNDKTTRMSVIDMSVLYN